LPFRKLEMPARLLTEYYPDKQIVFQQILLENHEIWLKAIEANPNLTVATLNDELVSVYRWLYVHDNTWWEKYKIPPAYAYRAKQRIDWQSRDLLLLPNIKPIVDVFLDESVKPTRISIPNLRNELKNRGLELSWFTRPNLTNLPQTDAYLSTVLETPEQFGLRRIKWAESYYSSKKISPGYHVFLKRATLTIEIAKRLPMMQAIEAALQRLLRYRDDDSMGENINAEAR
jgi:hypothetical protein